jgi:hypothetical protein
LKLILDYYSIVFFGVVKSICRNYNHHGEVLFFLSKSFLDLNSSQFCGGCVVWDNFKVPVEALLFLLSKCQLTLPVFGKKTKGMLVFRFHSLHWRYFWIGMNQIQIGSGSFRFCRKEIEIAFPAV